MNLLFLNLTYNRGTLYGENEIAVWRARCMTNLAGFRQKIRLFLPKFDNIFKKSRKVPKTRQKTPKNSENSQFSHFKIQF